MIVGIIIIVAGSLFFIDITPEEEVDLTFPDVESSVTDCLKTTATEGITYIAYKGGNYNNTNDDILNIPAYAVNGENTMPELEKIATQLSYYIDDNIDSCLGYKREGYAIEYGERFIDVIIADSIQIMLDMKTTVFNKEHEKIISSYQTNIDSDFMKYYQDITAFIEDHTTNYTGMVEYGYFEYHTEYIPRGNSFIIMLAEEKENPLIYNFRVIV